ncbi:MAG: outer membrane lipoprotein-sorting protein [Pseudomonadota bacterium]
MDKRFFLTLLLICAMPSMAVEIPAEIKACMKKNLPATTARQSIELRARDRSNYEQVMQADVFWKRQSEDNSRVMMHFSEPVDIRSARFLIIQKQPQNEMYIYMPALFKVRRVTSRNISGSVMGTDFSYEDFERLHGVLTDLKMEQFPDDVVAGRPAWVLMSYPDETSGYVKIASYIDKETCVALKSDLYEKGHQLRKQLTIDPARVKKIDTIWYPTELLMKDFRDKTETRLIVTNIKIGSPLDDSLFDETRLKQANIPPFD